MYNHAPKNYQCPFCKIVLWIKDHFVDTTKEEIIYKDDFITAFISSLSYPNNKWHILIIPNRHFENLYNLPNYLSNHIHKLERKIAILLKDLYKCDWITIRQNNEPAWEQDVWHYHIHIIPRYKNDNLWESKLEKVSLEERLYYADKFRNRIKDWQRR